MHFFSLDRVEKRHHFLGKKRSVGGVEPLKFFFLCTALHQKISSMTSLVKHSDAQSTEVGFCQKKMILLNIFIDCSELSLVL